MSDVLIIGNGGHARACVDALSPSSDLTPIGCVGPQPGDVLGLPYLGDDALLPRLAADGLARAFVALGDNAIRAESLGISVRGYTLLSFAIGAAYAGVAGGLFASLVQFIEPGPFTVAASIMMYLMVVVGGPGYFLGPVLGAAVGVVLPEWLRDVPGVANWYLPAFGAAVVLLMVWLPDGLLSIPDRLRARREAREASAARTAAARKEVLQ